MKKTNTDIFQKLCRNNFKFLEDEFGFNIVSSEKDPFGYYMLYQNSTTAIRISYEPREGGLFILLSRLVDGKVPAYPVFIESETPLYSFYLDDLISLRAPATKINYQIDELLTPHKLEHIIAHHANVIKQHAQDVLKGDFEVFCKLEEVVKRRAQELKKDKNDKSKS